MKDKLSPLSIKKEKKESIVGRGKSKDDIVMDYSDYPNYPNYPNYFSEGVVSDSAKFSKSVNVGSNVSNDEYLTYLNLPLLNDEELIKLLRGCENGDRESLEKLYYCYLKIVPKIAKKYALDESDYEDMISEGNIGLWKAVHKVRSDKSDNVNSILSYFRRAVSNKIINYIRDRKFTVKTGRHSYNCHRIEYEDENGDIKMIRHKDLIDEEDPYLKLDKSNIYKESVCILEEVLGIRDSEIFFEVIEGSLSYVEIGKKYKVSKPRVCQIYYKGLNCLRNRFLFT